MAPVVTAEEQFRLNLERQSAKKRQPPPPARKQLLIKRPNQQVAPSTRQLQLAAATGTFANQGPSGAGSKMTPEPTTTGNRLNSRTTLTPQLHQEQHRSPSFNSWPGMQVRGRAGPRPHLGTYRPLQENHMWMKISPWSTSSRTCMQEYCGRYTSSTSGPSPLKNLLLFPRASNDSGWLHVLHQFIMNFYAAMECTAVEGQVISLDQGTLAMIFGVPEGTQ